MNLAALVSGGKDSLYAAYLASKDHKIKYIISIISENPESYMFHVPNAALVAKQAEVMRIPLIQQTTKGEKEKELKDLKIALQAIRYKIDGIVTGAIQSNYQKTRIDEICKELNLKSIAPLWQKNPLKLIKQMIVDNFEVVITAVAAPPMTRSWLGKFIDEKTIKKLVKLNKEHGISIVGEGGEYETFVINCPLFKRRLIILNTQKHWHNKTKSGELKIDIQ